MLGPPVAVVSRSLVVLAVVLVALGVRWQQPHLRDLLGTDEADYVRALSFGVAPNYFGTRERSGLAFLTGVIDEYRRTGWARPFQQDWDADDAAGLRHYHPPFAMYPLGVGSWAGRDELRLRLTPLAQGALAAGAACLLTLVLLGASSPARVPLALAAGLLTALSPYHAEASTEIGAHAAFSLVSVLVLSALTLAVERRSARWWIAACGLTGLAMLTVPYWALLLPALLWVWWQGRLGESSQPRLAVGGMLAAIAVATIAWPPFFLQLAFVKPVLMYAGIMLRPLSHNQAPGAWLPELLRAHGALAALMLASLVAAPMMTRERLRILAPVLIFVLGFLAVNLRVGHMKPLYAADVIAPLAALVMALIGAALARLPLRPARALAGAAVLVVVAGAALSGSAAGPAGVWRPALADLNRELAGRRVLVTPRPAAAMVKYYVSGAQVVADSSDSADRVSLDRALSARDIDTVLRWGSTVEPGGAAAALVHDPPGGKVVVSGTIVSWWHP